MAYNLNYNPGIEHDRSIRRRRAIIGVVIILVILVAALLIYVGLKNRSLEEQKQDQSNSAFEQLSSDQQKELLKNMTATSNATSVVATSELKTLDNSMSANEASSSDDTGIIRGQEKENLLEAMSAH